MWKIKLEKIVANLSDIKASKIVHEWNGHIEIVGRPEVMENSKQYLLLRTDVLKSGWVSLCYRCASMVFFFIHSVCYSKWLQCIEWLAYERNP